MKCPWIATATKHTVSGKAAPGEHWEKGSEQSGGTVSGSGFYMAILKIKKTNPKTGVREGVRRRITNFLYASQKTCRLVNHSRPSVVRHI